MIFHYLLLFYIFYNYYIIRYIKKKKLFCLIRQRMYVIRQRMYMDKIKYKNQFSLVNVLKIFELLIRLRSYLNHLFIKFRIRFKCTGYQYFLLFDIPDRNIFFVILRFEATTEFGGYSCF